MEANAGHHRAEPLWSVHDVSTYLAVPVGTIYQWRLRGEGPPALKLGRHLRYVPSVVHEWVASRAEAS